MSTLQCILVLRMDFSIWAVLCWRHNWVCVWGQWFDVKPAFASFPISFPNDFKVIFDFRQKKTTFLQRKTIFSTFGFNSKILLRLWRNFNLKKKKISDLSLFPIIFMGAATCIWTVLGLNLEFYWKNWGRSWKIYGSSIKNFFESVIFPRSFQIFSWNLQ